MRSRLKKLRSLHSGEKAILAGAFHGRVVPHHYAVHAPLLCDTEGYSV
jgi:hypothetical protein